MTYEEIHAAAEKALPEKFTLEMFQVNSCLVSIGIMGTNGIWRGTYVTPEEITNARLGMVLQGVISSITGEKKKGNVEVSKENS